MAKEIERKFICNLDASSTDLDIVSTKRITQGYLAKGPTSTVRVRIANDQAFITIKSKRINLSCDEYEYEIPLRDAQEMMKMSITPLVEKTRYVVRDVFAQVWDIDWFHGINEGLVVAEIELRDENETIVVPPWATKEVSHDKRFRNTYLAEHRVTVDDVQG